MAEYDPAGSNEYDATLELEDNNEPQLDQADVEEDEDYDPSFGFGDGEDAAAAMPDTAQPDVGQPTDDGSKRKTVAGFEMSDDENEEQDPKPHVNGGDGEEDTATVNTPQNIPLASEPSQEEATATAQPSAPLNGSNSSLPLPTSVSNGTDAAMTAAAEVQSALQDQDSIPTVSAPTIQSPTAPEGKQQTQTLPSATVSAIQSATATPQPPTSAVGAVPAQTGDAVTSTPTTQRLPHDKVGQLEDRIKGDPRADTDAWWALVKHYREKGQIDQARKVYERFVEVFPYSASIWLDYAKMELSQENRPAAENIFHRTLLKLPSLELWHEYLNYLRRINPLVNDTDGSKRKTISSAFDLLLDNVGMDPDSGPIWREWIEFIKGGPGVTGGQGWQDHQKVDLLRKAYQRAVRLPHSELTKLWKEYDNFELTVNKQTARKFMQEHSPYYMQARMAKTQLDQIMAGLDRMMESLPVLPPIYGSQGEDAFATQVEKQRAFVQFAKDDPLALKSHNIEAYQKGVVDAYKMATAALTFYPEIWFEAASWCFEEGGAWEKKGDEFLDDGIKACPESVLLTLKKADRVESKLPKQGNDEVAIKNGEALDEVFEVLHGALYGLHKKTVDRMEKDISEVKAYYASLPPEDDEANGEMHVDEEDDEDAESSKPKSRKQQEEDQIAEVKKASMEHQDTVKKTITYVWVAKMRAFRRIQGQGAQNSSKPGLRGVFSEARRRGRITSEVYIAAALMEWKVYEDVSGDKIFTRGLKLFPTDEVFALEYIKHLVSKNDDTNARSTFETSMSRIMNANNLTAEDKKDKCRPLLGYMHSYESNYGELHSIRKIEDRMREMYPDESDVSRFGDRYALPSIDALSLQLFISPSQARHKTAVLAPEPGAPLIPQAALPSTEDAQSPPESGQLRLGPNGPYMASPKRGLEDSSDNEGPARKFARGESPLKGAAGRRMQGGGAPTSTAPPPSSSGGAGSGFMTKTYIPGQPPQQQQPAPTGYTAPAANHPTPLPYSIHNLLSRLPAAKYYGPAQFDPVKVVEFMQNMNLPERR